MKFYVTVWGILLLGILGSLITQGIIYAILSLLGVPMGKPILLIILLMAFFISYNFILLKILRKRMQYELAKEREPDKKLINVLNRTLEKLQPLFITTHDYCLFKVLYVNVKLNEHFRDRILMLDDWFGSFKLIPKEINLKKLLEYSIILQLIMLLKYTDEIFTDFQKRINTNKWPSSESQKAYQEFQDYYNDHVVKQLQSFFEYVSEDLGIKLPMQYAPKRLSL